MIRSVIASQFRRLARASTRLANRIDPIRAHEMKIHLGKPLTAESAAELARSLENLISARREERGAA